MTEQESQMLVIYPLDGDLQSPMVGVTPPDATTSTIGLAIKACAKNLPFYVFANSQTLGFNYEEGLFVNWSGAPIGSDDIQANNNAALLLLANPPTDKVSGVPLE